MSEITFQECFKIRASEIDFNQKATLPAICNLLQEVAGNHARELEFDITDLQKDELTWVLHRLHVKMDRFPDWRETITIKTWPSSGDGLRAYRDFLIMDENGDILGRSLSYWLIMNIQSRRPARIPKKILEMAPKDTDHVLPVTDASFSDLNQADYSQEFEVRKTDLDLNRHVNNVRLIEWALSCLPDGSNVNEIDIQFMAESVLGDTDIVEVQKRSSDSDSQYFHHQILRASDDKTLAKATSR
ncbi:acyl-[acyl-carrier-protein] thioesterase [Fodinibius sp.]|uniref:acyl-[acyl-carrier-protein] thioesterase n=1 Tax=Fodinibius sp. TaxID=1872440 RepID=UPI002ACE13C1|nr:acyl-ACP thioesterase domain-containing protein [Fodinibius sp.]MDZ7659780.1 thioesterase [Fodinibius sp.]